VVDIALDRGKALLSMSLGGCGTLTDDTVNTIASVCDSLTVSRKTLSERVKIY
jgi:hypothetical protein